MKNDTIESRIAREFARLEQVEAVLLAGSRTANTTDRHSDYDFYIYTTAVIDPVVRDGIAACFAGYREIDNRFWETGDEWTLREGGTGIDIMYRSYDWLKEQVERSTVHHLASVGYTTCFWYNLLTSEIIFDRAGRLTALQRAADVEYPEALRLNIVAKNHPVIRTIRSSYRHQLELAVERGDRVSVNHRVAAVLASYFDILFAVNRLPHPGEKRQIRHLTERGQLLPQNMEADVHALLESGASGGDVPTALDRLMDGLDGLLQEAGLLEG